MLVVLVRYFLFGRSGSNNQNNKFQGLFEHYNSLFNVLHGISNCVKTMWQTLQGPPSVQQQIQTTYL